MSCSPDPLATLQSSTAKPIRMHHETVQLRLQDYSSGATEIRGTKQPSGSCVSVCSWCEGGLGYVAGLGLM